MRTQAFARLLFVLAITVVAVNGSGCRFILDFTNPNGGTDPPPVDPGMDPPPVEQPSGPDIIVGLIELCTQLGRTGPVGAGTIAIGCDTLACNIGDENLNWLNFPNTDHPVIIVNAYRLRNSNNIDYLEQIGQSWVKHTFATEVTDESGCGQTCHPSGTETQMGPGCRDAYLAEEFYICGMGPRSAVHPYTGEMPSGDSLGSTSDCSKNYPARNHIGHVHTDLSHRVQIKENDLIHTSRFFSEAAYVSLHESSSGNQNNNYSYHEIYMEGPDDTGVYAFTDSDSTVTEEAAIHAWPGAEFSIIEPERGTDGRAEFGYKATDIGGGQWHYEYAIENMNLDRGIRSLRIPIPTGVTVRNIEFYAPAHQPPEAHSENYSNSDWLTVTGSDVVGWETSTYGENRLANAIRWGTMYNFRFDADAPPGAAKATVGFFKTGGSIEVDAIAPAPPGPG